MFILKAIFVIDNNKKAKKQANKVNCNKQANKVNCNKQQTETNVHRRSNVQDEDEDFKPQLQKLNGVWVLCDLHSLNFY